MNQPLAIEIPTLLDLSRHGERQELQLRGRVLAPAGIKEIAVIQEGAVAFRLRHHGAHTPDQGRYGFSCDLTRPASRAGDAWNVDIVASGHGITAGRAAFRIADLDAATARVLDGPSAAAIAADDPLPPVILHVEHATLTPDMQLRIDGWALARDTLRTIRVFDGVHDLGNAILGRTRQDVAGWRPEYPNAAESGFVLSLQLPPGEPPSILRIEAETGGAHQLELTVPLERIGDWSAPKPIGRRAINLFCDEAFLTFDGQLSVIGWAISATGISGVDIFLDGQQIGETEFGLPRHDVGDEYVMIPMARYSGFRLDQAVPDIADDAKLCITARNGIGDTGELQVAIRRAKARTDGKSVILNPLRKTEFRLEIDSPIISDGLVREPVGGRLTISGWALCRAGVAGIEIALDGQQLGGVHYGLARQDVAHAFPDWPNAVRSGFTFHCPPRLLRNGTHQVELRVRAVTGEMLSREFRFETGRTDDAADATAIRRRITRSEVEFYSGTLQRFGARPVFQIVLLATERPDRPALSRTLNSLVDQVAADWRLLIVTPDAGAAVEMGGVLAEFPIDLIRRTDLLYGDLAWPTIISLPALIGCLGIGDELGRDALAEIAVACALSPGTDLVYADESRISPVTNEREPFFKPDFSPDLLLGTNYIGRPWFATPSTIAKTGVMPGALLAGGEYDLILRCAEQASIVTHVPRLLCERAADASASVALERQALMSAAQRRGMEAEIAAGPVPGTWRLRRTAVPHGLVSIIIPTCASGGHIETCLNGLRQQTGYRNIEIICIENIGDEQSDWREWLHRNADTVLTCDSPFNWSSFNNRAATLATGDYLLFLNDDIEIEQRDWLEAMLEHAVRPEIGVVGPRLLYPDRTVQHAGMFLAGPGVGRHAFRLANENDPGYFGLARMQREVSAVTGACMLMRRSHFVQLGGFDEAHPIVNNDVDFCLRTTEAGRRIVYTPHATLIHHEQASRGELPDLFDHQRFAARWRRHFAAGDPFHNPNLSSQHDDLRPNEEPARVVHGGKRLFAAADIGRILVVKVDHIGDFMTALPALRRLKSHFPAAEIHILSSPATTSFGTLEPAITSMIPFEFFHARSALGQKTIAPEQLDDLRRRLAPYHFDLAIDMRKHPETRPLLRAAGARYLAGFDFAGQFPWLDLALEWEGDRGLHPKRFHVSHDLLHLVDAVASGSGPEQLSLDPAVIAAAHETWPLPDQLVELFARPVVCVHPGAGNEMKQWPTEHFVALIDLLTQDAAVNIVLIGGPDEVETADRIVAATCRPDAVRTAVNEIPLECLPALFSRCTLFVGNDSGPKHIAASVGIPTVGIHSGTVDPTEWGPLGSRSFAIARQMSCSPCYINRAADCVRDIACIRQIEPRTVFRLCRLLLGRNVPQ
ncbi:MAG TPA: glycosyltransferase family 9 protein [Acetobacteraceae bacterium]